MPFYLFQGKYSSASIKAMIDNPQDREAAVRPLFEAMGATLHHLFFCFGEDDVIALIEAPDDATLAACSMIVGSSGSMASGATTKLMTSAEAMAAMKKADAGRSSYSPASG